MENLTHAIYMAFAMLAFVIAFSTSLYLVNKLNTTAKTLVYSIDGSYYDSLSLNQMIEDNEDRNRSRIVGIDTIIPTLYRYYKESFAVKILDENGDLLQYFDTTTELDVNAAKSEIKENRTGVQKALLSLYDANELGNEYNSCYMFGAPWLANINKDAKTRVDMYINGGKGYINNTLVDYSRQLGSGGSKKYVYLNYYKDRKFKEIFTQYAYEGDTISDETNGELVTLTGSKQISTKIIIIYQMLPV
ncbi:MAG: hypothetical protein IJ629_00225 [Clostridia bacterium]|nr:hypothetical protein [Clostridia bacterium]